MLLAVEIIISESPNNISEIKYNDVTAIWLSRFPTLNNDGRKRLVFQYGYSVGKTKGKNNILYPSIDFGLKTMKNLSISSKLYGASFGGESVHVIGSGLQYFYGNEDTLNWVSCFQRVDLKAGRDYKLSTITMDIRKLFNLNFLQFRIGIGSNFYKKRLFDSNVIQFITSRDQINFVGLDAVVPHRILNFGIDVYITSSGILSSLFIQKEFF